MLRVFLGHFFWRLPQGVFSEDFLVRTLVDRSGCSGSLGFVWHKGEMLRVFFILCFCVWFGVFCRFFAVLLFLGSLFEKIFGSELLFLGVVVGLVFFWWVFAYVFALCFGGSLPKVSLESVWKNSLDVIFLRGRLLFLKNSLGLLKKISGANFCFLGVGVGHVFVGAVLLMFLLYVLAARSRSCLEKFS